MAARRFTARFPDLKDARVLVIGLGRSGRAAALLARDRGARVTVADARPETELGDSARELYDLGIGVLGGGHPPALARTTDLLVLSPGVPTDVPLAEACRERGVPVWGEVELASRFCDGRIIGITGSNGKSTTTTMTGAILRTAGIPGGTGGNLATPLTELLAHDAGDAVHAVELSSFQLETIESFRATIAVVVNLTPDHLDRYPSFDAYGRAKARLFETQTVDDHAILNGDDPEAGRFERSIKGRAYRFSARGKVYQGAYLDQGRLRLRTDFGEDDVLGADELPVPGLHNVENALAAALAARLAGCAPETIAEGLRNFRPLRHRLEPVAEIDGVRYFNDSKATNLDSAARAVRSFPRGTIHLILGGRDKDGDWKSFVDVVRDAVRRVLLVGEAAGKIRESLGDAVPMEDCRTIPAALRTARDGARPGDVVVLAPGCASFDQYPNFEARGDDFRRVVDDMARGEDADA